MPYRLQTSGVGWLVAAVVLVGLALAVSAGGMHRSAVAVTVVDDAFVRWLAELEAPGLEALWRGLVRVGSWWVLITLSVGLLPALLVLRRWRHLSVWLLAWQLGSIVTVGLATIAQRSRPFGSASDLEGGFASEAPLLLGLVARQGLGQALGQRSDGRLRLDPREAR